MKITNLNVFCKTEDGDIGIAVEGPFASSAWRISDEAFNSVSGNKFAWIAPDGNEYTEDKNIFERPTEADILLKATTSVIEKALSLGYIEISSR